MNESGLRVSYEIDTMLCDDQKIVKLQANGDRFHIPGSTMCSLKTSEFELAVVFSLTIKILTLICS